MEFCIYELNDKNGLFYVGKSTHLQQRLQEHKTTIKYGGHCSSRELDIDFTHRILETTDDENVLALLEQKWYDIYKDKYGDKFLNKNRPLNTIDMKEYHKSYYEEHKECLKSQNKAYYEEHKDEISDYRKAYYEENKEEIKKQANVYYNTNKDKLTPQRLAYREIHKEEISDNKKAYYEEHKEEIKKKSNLYRANHKDELNIRILCECGIEYTKRNKGQHNKTQKHINQLKK